MTRLNHPGCHMRNLGATAMVKVRDSPALPNLLPVMSYPKAFVAHREQRLASVRRVDRLARP